MDDKRIELMKNTKISKAINTLAVPAIIGLLVLAIYNFVDTMFVAWLGTEATGATQVVMPITMLVSAFGLAFGIGGSSYVSRLLGMNMKDKANEVGTVIFFTAIGMGVIVTILLLVFLEPVLGFFGADESVMAMSKDYGFYILLASTFTMGNMTLNNLLRGEGSAKLSMIGMSTGAILNIALDPLFIFTFDLGISGAAIATTLSQGVTFAILISRYINHHSVLRIEPKYFKPSRGMYGEVFKVGVPTFMRQVLLSVSVGIMNQMAMVYGGSDLLAAVGLLFKTTMIPMFVIFGIGQGLQPIAGYNYGAKNNKRVKEALKYSIKASLVVAVISGVLMIVFDREILSIFKATDTVNEYVFIGIRYYSIANIIMAFTNCIGTLYQSIGKGRESLVLSITRQGVFFIPSLYILPLLIGDSGILAAQLSADILTLILTMVIFIPFIRSAALADRYEVSLEGEVS